MGWFWTMATSSRCCLLNEMSAPEESKTRGTTFMSQEGDALTNDTARLYIAQRTLQELHALLVQTA